jgi:hypothetical protein
VAKHPVKVLQVIDTLGVGGAETWLLEVLRLWSGSGAGQLDFLITSGKRGIFDEEAQQLGAKIYYLRYGRTRLLRFANEFRRIVRDGKYHAIHDHQDFASGWHFLMGAGLLPDTRLTHVHNPAYQIRNNYGVTFSRRVAARIGKALVARYSTHITGTSRQVLTEYGFDTPRFHKVPKLHCIADLILYGSSGMPIWRRSLYAANSVGLRTPGSFFSQAGSTNRRISATHKTIRILALRFRWRSSACVGMRVHACCSPGHSALRLRF